MVVIQEFEFVEDEGFVLALPFGMEGGTQGSDLADAVEMAVEWLKLHALYALAQGRELPETGLGHEARRGGRVIAVAVEADRSEIPAMTAAEAARKLGVSTARVSQLCRAGELDSWRIGATRMVSRESVEYRLRMKPLPGRPAANERRNRTGLRSAP